MLQTRFWSPLCPLRLGAICALLMGSLLPNLASAQQTIALNDLNAFREPGKSWQIVGRVQADLQKPNTFTHEKGEGILLNLPGKKVAGTDLITTFEHGDLDLELDYMMAKGANSGIYLQGMYEVQLEDSWGITAPTFAHNGGIYERWDDSKLQGRKGFEGYAPRQNVSKAPGLWQKIRISFQAPRFDASGKKTENARLLRVELNGVLLHENVELTGPTRGAMGGGEKASGPLRLQGDHGAVAFRNIRITHYDKPRPELLDLRYTVYKGQYDQLPAYDSLPPEAEGSSVLLTSSLSPMPEQFLLRYQASLRIHEAGEYRFNLNVPGGRGYLKIGDQLVVPLSEWSGKNSIDLPAGDMPFELVYNKFIDWATPALGLGLAGPGIREYLLSDEISGRGNVVDPILVDPLEKPILRSFMDLPNMDLPNMEMSGMEMSGRETKPLRVTHAINVGSAEQLHYTYDLNSGHLVQLWRGGFLDATPMWHDRGDGSSRPLGAVQVLGRPTLSLVRLGSAEAAWPADTTGSGYRPKGYLLDAQGRPSFRYGAWGAQVEDAIRVLPGGQGFQRQISLQQPAEGLYVRLAAGSRIEAAGKNWYLIDDQAYYLRLDDAGGAKPLIRSIEGGQELILPLRSKLVYSLLF
jgi:hypothetical protein